MFQLSEQNISSREVSRILAAQGYEPLDVKPFEVIDATIRSTVRRIRQQRAGETYSPLAGIPASSAVGELMRRMVTIAEREIVRMTRRQAMGKLDAVTYERMSRAMLRLAETAEKLPGPDQGKRGKGRIQEAEPDDDFEAQLQADASADPANPPTPSTATGTGAALAADNMANGDANGGQDTRADSPDSAPPPGHELDHAHPRPHP